MLLVMLYSYAISYVNSYAISYAIIYVIVMLGTKTVETLWWFHYQLLIFQTIYKVRKFGYSYYTTGTALRSLYIV